MPSPPADRTSRDWQRWGEVDPLYAVASLPERAKSGPNPWTERDFYASGEVEWQSFADRWLRYGVDSGGTVLELGCGAGRLTRQLAHAFAEVVGVDVSPEQLRLAEAAVADAPGSCRFELASVSRLAMPDRSVDAVFSTHVLQHLPLGAVRGALAECGRVLAPGGSVMLHLPIAGTSLAGSYTRWLAGRALRLEPLRRELFRLGHRLGRTVPPMRFRLFDPAWVFEQLERGGLGELELQVFESNGMRYSFFFATKRKSPQA